MRCAFLGIVAIVSLCLARPVPARQASVKGVSRPTFTDWSAIDNVCKPTYRELLGLTIYREGTQLNQTNQPAV